MMIRRLPNNFETNLISQIVANTKDRRIDLTNTNPTNVGLEYPFQKLKGILFGGSHFRYEPHPRGLLSARKALSDFRSQENRSLDADRVWLTSGTSEGYSFLCKCLTDPGDEVLVPSPSYPLFRHLLNLEGVQAIAYSVQYAEGWFIDLEALKASVTSKTRAIVLVNPNNPTGHYARATEMRALYEIATEYSLALIVDEVFFDFPLEKEPERHSFAVTDVPALTFVLDGLSKLVGLPQLKLSWLSAHGPSKLVQNVAERLDWISDLYLSVGTLVQQGVPRLLKEAQALTSMIQSRVQINHQFLLKTLNPGKELLHYLPTEGGWSAIFRLPDHCNEEKMVMRLVLEDRVVVQPGYFFDLPFRSSLVISLLPDPNEFQEGIQTVLRAIQEVR